MWFISKLRYKKAVKKLDESCKVVNYYVSRLAEHSKRSWSGQDSLDDIFEAQSDLNRTMMEFETTASEAPKGKERERLLDLLAEQHVLCWTLIQTWQELISRNDANARARKDMLVSAGKVERFELKYQTARGHLLIRKAKELESQLKRCDQADRVKRPSSQRIADVLTRADFDRRTARLASHIERSLASTRYRWSGSTSNYRSRWDYSGPGGTMGAGGAQSA